MPTARLLKAALALLLAALASSGAQALTRTGTCGQIRTFADAAGSGTAICPSAPLMLSKTLAQLADYDLNGVTLTYLADYGFGTSATNNIAFSFTPGGPGAVSWADPSRTVNVSGGLNSGTFTPPPLVSNSVTSGLSFANFESDFDVGLLFAPIQGAATRATGQVTITYEYAPAGGGSAVTITRNCGSIKSFPNASGQANVSCPSVTAASGQSIAQLAGHNLTGVKLDYYSDFDFGQAFFNIISFKYSTGAPAGVTWSNPLTTVNVPGGSPTPVTDSVTAGLSFANFASNFSVAFDSLPTQGGAFTSSALVTVTYDYSLKPPVAAVPEPATAGLFGLGLAGLLLARRRRADC